MSFTWTSRVLGSLTALVLMAGVRGGQLDGDLQEICSYCQMDDLMPCDDSAGAQIEVTVKCASCILGLAEPYGDPGNLTMTTIGPDQVCLLRSDNAIHPSTSRTDALEASTRSFDEHMVTVTGSTPSSEAFDYQADPAEEFEGSFRSEPVGEAEKVSPPKSEGIECFSCESSSAAACLGDVEKLKPIKCPEPDECITTFEDGNVVRNCSSAFPEDTLARCREPNNTGCTLCSTAKCNKVPWSQCYRCSSKDAPNCTLPTDAPDSLPAEVCPNYNDVCLVRVTKDGDTVRECSRPGTKCPQGEMCSSCDDTCCNGGVFPANRTRCIQCQDCETEQDPRTALPCARYIPEEKCFSYVTAKSKMNRGCLSDAEDMQRCQASGPKCVTCGDRDGCNDMPLMKDPSLSCFRCNSNEDADCAWAQQPKTAVKCLNKVLYYLEETCMMEFDAESMIAVRACSFDHGVCTSDDKNCRTCTGDGCNGANLKVQECIQCISESPGQANCSRLAEGIPSTKCPQDFQPYQSRGCFTMTKGNVTTRGCVAGLSPDNMKLCTLEQSQCKMCMDDGCNNRLAPSGGGKAVVMSLLMWILVISVAA